MVSVIIPTYNRSVLLQKAIESVFAQTIPCDEILVIDDGSTDDTYHAVEKLSSQADIPIRYIFQKNSGAAAARNKGIYEAQNNLLCFLDSDDCFVPHKIEQQLFEMEKAPQFLISHTREIWYYDSLGALTNELKGIGAHNQNSGQASGLTGKSKLKKLKQTFENRRVDGKGIPVTYDLVQLHLVK